MPNEQNQTEPSAQTRSDTQKKHKGKVFSWVKRIFYGFIGCLILAAAVLILVIKSDLGGSFLDDKVQAKLQQKIGAFAAVTIENARLSLDDDYHLALEVDDTPITPHADTVSFSKLGRLRFGFASLPLLRRKIEVIQLEADNASVLIHRPDSQKGLFAFLPHDDKQRVDFNAAAELSFSSLEKLAQAIDKLKINTFRLSNTAFTIDSPSGTQSFIVRQARLRRLRKSVDMQAVLSWLGQDISIKASAALEADGRVRSFTAKAENVPVRLGAEDSAKPYLLNGRPNSGFFRLRGLSDITLSGTRDAGEKKKLTAELTLKDARSDIALAAKIPAAMTLKADYQQGGGDIAIYDSAIKLGGLNLPFSGAFGPMAAARADSAPAAGSAAASPPLDTAADGLYNFTLKAEDALSSAGDAPSAALNFDLDVSGRFAALDKKFNLDNIALQTEDSAILGNGSVRFGAQRWPELIFVLHSARLPIDEAKQLWPLNIARSARQWALSHIFGGDLTDMQIEIALPEGFYQKGKLPPLLTGRELSVSTGVENSRADLIGTLPPLREAYGQVRVEGTNTAIRLNKALAYLDNGQQINAADGQMAFVWHPGKPLWADLSVHIGGAIGAIGKLLACEPVNAAQKVPFDMQAASGAVQALVKLNFPLFKGAKPQDAPRGIQWKADIGFQKFALGAPYRGTIQVSDANGRVQIDNSDTKAAQIDGAALLNGIPADISMLYPLNNAASGDTDKTAQTAAAGAAADANFSPKKEQITFHFDNKLRNKLFPALDIFLSGNIAADVGPENAGRRPVRIDLSKAVVQIPWIGWKKGSGIAAYAEMSLPMTAGSLKNIDINDFVLNGPNFQIAGKIKIRDGNFVAADFGKFNLNRSDRLALAVNKTGKIYQIKLNGSSFDMRAFIKNLSASSALNAGPAGGNGDSGIVLTAAIENVQGFNNEILRNFRSVYNRDAAGNDSVRLSAATKANASLNMRTSKQSGQQQISVITDDAGAFLRFMNYYDKVQGGRLESKLQSLGGSSALAGPVRISNFAIINEPKLAALVSKSKDKDGKLSSTYLAVDMAHGRITKGAESFTIDHGVLRGPSVGATFQGSLYDPSGNIAMTGTYMPIYGLNRIFGDVPILGSVLGNGRDKGLIGITFKIEGKFKAPKVVVNPISAIAPGILRSMFEFKQP